MEGKKVAAIVLNRNLPKLADELGEWIMTNSGELVDLYVVENGSDEDKYSKFANIIFKESWGPARGVNEALKRLMQEPYEYFWVNYNDARYEAARFVRAAVAAMERDSRLGLVTGYWEGNMTIYGQRGPWDVLSTFEVLGFVISRRALLACQAWPEVKLDPFWDGSNYSGHFNSLASALALYESGFYVAAGRQYKIYEQREAADEDSRTARGMSDQEWKHVKGPADRQRWLARAFPQYRGEPKEIRRQIVRRIVREIIRRFPDIKPDLKQLGPGDRLRYGVRRLVW